jgi:hypothetical protein
MLSKSCLFVATQGTGDAVILVRNSGENCVLPKHTKHKTLPKRYAISLKFPNVGCCLRTNETFFPVNKLQPLAVGGPDYFIKAAENRKPFGVPQLLVAFRRMMLLLTPVTNNI